MIVALLPAYQAEKTLATFLKQLPKNLFDEIILVDDSSTDNTFEIAKKQSGIRLYKTPQNLGYGGTMKFGLKIALESGAHIIVEIHPDGEYLPDGILPALEKIKQGAKLVLGNRFSHTNPKGMYGWKVFANKLLTWIDNSILQTHFPDLHQGFRVYTKDFLKHARFAHNSNDFTFTFEVILQAIYHKFPIAVVPVTAIYKGRKRGVTTKNGAIYTIKSFWVLLLFILSRHKIIRSKRFL